MYKIGIDLGGTNIACGIIDGTKMIHKRSTPTGDVSSTELAAKALYNAADALVADNGLTWADIDEIGIGIPGTVNADTGVVELACNLNLENSPFPALLAEMTGKPVFAENDANAAAWGEYIAGCGKEYRSMVMLTLGTGVGGGIVTDGKIYSGFNSSGAEIGHMVTRQGGRQCACGRKGCFEKYASATGLIETTREHMKAHPESKLWEIAGDLDGITGKTAFEALHMGDEAAAAAVKEYTEDLACGIVNVINIFQPELVVLSGGVSNAGDDILIPVRKIVSREDYARNSKKRAVVQLAELQNDAGIIGAALLGRKGE